MEKYFVKVTSGFVYSVPVEAVDEYEARQIARDMTIEELDEYKDEGFWDFELGEVAEIVEN